MIHLTEINLQMNPDWSAFQEFQVGTFQSVMRPDATSRARPMSFYADNPYAVRALFDFISYDKCMCQIFIW